MHQKWSGKGAALPPLPPLRTGRESFPSSGSSRYKAPRERSRLHDGCPGVPPLRYRLAVSDLAFTLVQLVWFQCVALPEDAHMDKSTFICFSSYESSTSFLVTNDPAGSLPAFAAGCSAPLSAPLQSGLCFLQRSSTRHSHSAPCGAPASTRRNVGFIMFRLNNADDLAPASAPAVVLSVRLDTESKRLTAYRFGRSLSASLARYS